MEKLYKLLVVKFCLLFVVSLSSLPPAMDLLEKNIFAKGIVAGIFLCLGVDVLATGLLCVHEAEKQEKSLWMS